MRPMLVFGIVLLLAGGLIAWLGDRLGTFIGRKRLSWFGLRPRHTAMLYTIFSGAIIAGLTFLVLITYDRSVRRALLEGDHIYAEIGELKSQKVQALDQAAAAKSQADAESRIVDEERETSAVVRGQLAAEVREYAASRRRSKQELDAAQSRLDAADERLDNAEQQYAAVTMDWHSAQHSVDEKRAEVAEARKQLVTALGDVERATTQVRTLTATGAELTAQNNELSMVNDELKSARVIYHAGDEVGRCEISTNQSVDAIHGALLNWMAELGNGAAVAGAAIGLNGRAVVVDDLPAGDSTAGDAGHPEDESIDALANAIASGRDVAGSVVVVATARYNTAKGQQVKIRLQPFANILAFTQGQTLAATTIDGTMPVDSIVVSIERFLTETVRPVVIAAHVMPQIDPVTHEKSYAEPINDWSPIVNKIEDIGKGAQVAAVVTEDIYTKGPVKFRLDITPPPAPVPPVEAAPTPAPTPAPAVVTPASAPAQAPRTQFTWDSRRPGIGMAEP